MAETKQCCTYCVAGKVKVVTFPDGKEAGIINLENILKEVAGLKLTDDSAIKVELLQRVKTCNYVVHSAEEKYKEVLFQEYQRRFGKSTKGK